MKVLVTHHIPDIGLDLLRGESVDLTVLDSKSKKSDIIKALKKSRMTP